MSQHFIDDIKPLLLWDEENENFYQKINNNYIGGQRVRIRKIEEIIYCEKTIEKININPTKYLLFLFNIVLPFGLTTSDTIIRWIERPERNSEEFHNWSNLALVYFEFSLLIVNLSLLIIFLFSLFVNNIIARYILTQKYNENIENIKTKILNYIPYIFGIISIPFDYIIVQYISTVMANEYSNFINRNTNITNITNINKNITNITNINTNITNGIGFETFTIYLLLFYTFIGLALSSKRLKYFNRNYNIKYNNFSNIKYYDPDLIKNIISIIITIKDFSLLKCIAWLRHDSYDFFCLLIHKVKNNEKLLEIKKNSFGFYIFIIIYLSISAFFSFIIWSSSFIYLGSFGLMNRIKTVSFVGYLEIYKWDKNKFLKFLAFLNNILSLDTGKKKSYKTIMYFLFAGEDALEDNDEKNSQDIFNNLLISYYLSEKGLFKTFVLFSQLNHKDIQKICILQEENITKNESIEIENNESIEIENNKSIEIENNEEDIIPKP